MAKAKKTTKTKKATKTKKVSKSFSLGVKGGGYKTVGGAKLKDKDIKSEREKSIGQHIGYRYDVNLIPDYKKLTPFLKTYIETMGWDDLNWLEDVHMGYEGDKPAVFDRNANGWITVPTKMKLPNGQQERDMLARELLIKFQMSSNHPLVALKKTYVKGDNFKLNE
tara:strand:+ start:74 stop:571 length:498 start_codon:yes stop_codon:yes gene_type:complete